MKFRKKPVVIEAVKWMGDNLNELRTELLSVDELAANQWRNHGGILQISTLEGVMEAQIGDWIIRGVKRECYPCKPDIFETTYEAVEPTATELGAEVRRLGLAGQ